MREQPPGRQQPARQPGGRADQQQRRGDHRVRDVLHHVHREQVALGDVVDRPVGGDPQREQPGRERGDLEPRDHRRAGRREPRTEPVHARARSRPRTTPTSSHTSGCACQAGNGTSPSTTRPTTSAPCSRTRGSRCRRRSPAPTIPTTKMRRKNGWSTFMCMYQPRDEEELRRAHREQGDDDQVRVRGVDVRDRDLDRR